MRPSCWIALIAAWLFAMPCIAQPDGREISLAYVDVEAGPFQTGTGPTVGDPPGLAVEMVASAVRSAGYSLKLRRLPQMRMLRELAEGGIDGAFIFSYTPERGELYAYPMHGNEPDGAFRVTRIRYSLYRLKGAAVGWDGQAFNGLSRPIGVNTGWVMAGLLTQRGLPVDDSGHGHTENFGKLRLKRIDAYAALEPAADSFLRASRQQDLFEKVGPPLQEKDYFLLFSKRFMHDSPEIAWAIWRQVKQVRERDEDRLYRKYSSGPVLP